MPDPRSSSYDVLPYPSYAYAVTHPDNLATIARLFGLSPAPVEQCRVLELGCASGGNLIPMAEGLPASRFVGIDASRRQIGDGRRLVRTLELANLELRAESVIDVGPELGQFDFIICHGVFSWVPEPVRNRILALCRDCLVPHGVACVSYNVYPGWHEAEMLLGILRYHTDRLAAPAERVRRARELLAKLVATVHDSDTRLPFLRAEMDRLDRLDDAYVFYEYLEGDNRPFCVHEIIARARSHGLQYLGDGHRATMAIDNQPREIAEVVGECSDVADTQQALDFFTNRRFRTTLLCHAERTIAPNPRPERVYEMFVRADVDPDPAEGNGSLDGEMLVETPSGHAATLITPDIRVALSILRREAPRPIPYSALVECVAARLRDLGHGDLVASDSHVERLRVDLAANLLWLYFTEVVELHVHAPEVANTICERPRTSRLTRMEASRGEAVTTRWHECHWYDASTRGVIALLDGTRTREELVRALADELGADPGAELDGVFEMLRREALLVPS